MAIKHKAIFTGKNKELIDDAFKQLLPKLDMFTTTLNEVDLNNHINFLHPSLLVYCANKETSDDISLIASIRENLLSTKTQLVLIGTAEECVKIDSFMPYKADLSIYTTRKKEDIYQQLLGLVDEMLPIKEEEKKHVLVIDDDPIMLKLIKEQLHEMYNVATAVNGKVALKFLDTKYTDLILLDYEMPEMNGPQVLNALRERDRTKDIPVVFLTGTKDREKVQNALLMKPQGYLLKPIDKEKLLEMIQSLI